MDVELSDIRQHMQAFAPFDTLSDELLDGVVNTLDIAYFKAQEQILEYDQPVDHFCYIRSGAVEVFRRNGQLYNRLEEGDIFGHFNLLRNGRVRFPAVALEDTLIYFIAKDAFDQLCEQDSHFADFVELEKPRLTTTVQQHQRNNDMLVTRIRRLIYRQPLVIGAGTPVQSAAAQMRDQQYSGALVIGPPSDNPRYTFKDGNDALWQVRGIITNADLRDKVVAEALPTDTPVEQLLSEKIIAVQSDASVYEAMLTMLRHNVHHLPVMHKRYPIGLVHLSDIIRYETQSSLYLVSNIFNQRNVKGLARLVPDVRATFIRLVDEGADANMVGQAMSTIGRAFSQRLLELAEEELGPPPVPYCLMALGSMARNEQLLVTDQDNALVIDDAFEPERHDAYFLALATRLSDGLDACGYPYCTGGIMATNPKWRQPLSQWHAYFKEWVAAPSPERLLHSSIFFDLDAVAGEHRLVEALQKQVATLAPQSALFLAAMARNALNRTPPLGLFRTFVVENDGKQSKGINLKRRGTAPLTDLIRVHALACGSQAQNSYERLDAIAKTQLLASGVPEKLRHALDYLTMTRIRHQVYALRHEQTPDNNVDPALVSQQERHHLKEAFQAISLAQKFLKYRYPVPALMGKGPVS